MQVNNFLRAVLTIRTQFMRKTITGIAFVLAVNLSMAQQNNCRTFEYQQERIKNDPSLIAKRQAVEDIIQQQSSSSSNSATSRVTGGSVIRIPVVVHILYHYAPENYSDERVRAQISTLNRDFRKQNADTTKIPSYFRALAADCEIEFELATVDPKGRATNGIVHKYTPITTWEPNDQMKYSSQMGDDAWDPNSYLNIWVCSLNRILGYSTFPGDDADKDGIVMAFRAFGGGNRTLVHEAGHWLGLKHLWGDENCGDDGVDDTPKQKSFTNGCPTGVRLSSCGSGNGPNGDMYMNYMDFTSDECIVMFTQGQKQRMKSMFSIIGPRRTILNSKALSTPWVEGAPLPELPPKWLQFRVFPNPVVSELTINLEYDARWIGRELVVVSLDGHIHMKRLITSKVTILDVSKLKPGVYFLRSEKEGEKLLQKFVKL